MIEKNISGHNYQIGRLDAFRQFHVARRLAPAIWVLGLAGAKADTFANADAEDSKVLGILGESIVGIANVISAMSNDDAEYVLRTCLSVCTREQTGANGGTTGWARVQAPNGAMMFEDMNNMTVMLQLVFAVIKENLSDFFSALPELSVPSGAAAAATPQ